MQYEASSNNSRLLPYVIIAALLVHVGMMTVFVIQQDHSIRIALPHQNAQDLHQPTSISNPEQQCAWANRKAANNQFGVPVVFYDEPEQEDVSAQDDQSKTQSDVAVQDEQQKQEHEAMQEKELAQEQHDVQMHQDDPEQRVVDQYQQDALERESVIELKNQSTAIIERDEQGELRSESPKKEHRVSSSAGLAGKKVVSPKQITARRAPIKQKNDMTLAQLAQGFLHYAQEESGDAPLEVRGGHDGRPSDEQLKHERYWQKIAWWLQREFRVTSFAPHEIPEPPFLIEWGLLLNRDGSIHDLVLITSSGNNAFDEKYARTVHAASSSFPPVPSFFEGDVYGIRFSDRADDTRRVPRIKITGH